MARTHGQNGSIVNLTVEGRRMPMVFSRREGGGTTAEISTSFPGGALPAVAVTAPATVEEITLNGHFVPARDHDTIRWLKSRTGRAECSIGEQMIDIDGRAFGRPDTWTGLLQSVHSGDYDANSSDPREFTIVVTPDGSA